VSAARPPEPLPAPAFDSHCHLEMIDRPTPDVVAEAAAAGITRMITIGTDLESSRWAAALAAQPGPVRAGVAIHPNSTADAAKLGKDEVLAELAGLAAQPSVVAVGETGLDYYRDHAPPEVQQEWFRAHIQIAKDTGKALVIHDREAHDDVLRLLAEEGAPDHVVFHCFSGGAGLARACADAGYVMSFAGNITFPSAQPLRDAAAVAPASLILVETDAPFLTPVPNRGKPNTPAMSAYTLRFIAGLKDMDTAELCAAVTATGDRVFGPWPAAPWPG
jgi:TatD DNase family protein